MDRLNITWQDGCFAALWILDAATDRFEGFDHRLAALSGQAEKIWYWFSI
jgi:hypothetical protein